MQGKCPAWIVLSGEGVEVEVEVQVKRERKRERERDARIPHSPSHNCHRGWEDISLGVGES